MNRLLKKLLPVFVIIFGIIISIIIIKSKPEVETVPVKIIPKRVKAFIAEKQSITITVKTQGTIKPGTETVLVSQVSGQIKNISKAFVNGGFFEKNDILLQIDDSDYKLTFIQLELQVAQAELRLKKEEQEANVAVQEWEKLNEGKPTSLAAREPQLNEAKRALEAANASLQQAKLNIERTNIRAPYSGRIRTKTVDLGQYVNQGMSLANIYGVDIAEVRLPVPDKELAYIDFPIDFRGLQDRESGPRIKLTTDFAGKIQNWEGYLSRIEGEIEQRSRMINLVAKINDPYGKSKTLNKPPLTVGMFVNAEIYGRKYNDIVIIPRSALRNENQVLIIDENNKLRFRAVEILKLESEEAYISAGIESGEKVCATTLTTVIEGMNVEIYEETKFVSQSNDGETK